jgi:hypothetical protein
LKNNITEDINIRKVLNKLNRNGHNVAKTKMGAFGELYKHPPKTCKVQEWWSFYTLVPLHRLLQIVNPQLGEKYSLVWNGWLFDLPSNLKTTEAAHEKNAQGT